MLYRKHLLIGLISFSLIGLELIWTRIFSAEFYYTFSFLILSLAILGLSMGGLSLRLFRKINIEKSISIILSIAALFAIIGPVLLFKLNIDFSILYSSEFTVLKFVSAILILSAPFFFGGMVLAFLFKTNHQEMPRLYMADMVGAGISIIFSIFLMNIFGTPSATFLISIPLITAAFLSKGNKLVIVVPTIILIILLINSSSLLRIERPERAPVIYEHWDAFSKIKMYEYSPEYRGINIDNLANTPVIGFDGNINDTILSGWDIDVKNLINRFDSCTFLSLGAGGGADVLQALGYGAKEIHAVEVNPHINKMLTEGNISAYIRPDSISKEDFNPVTCNNFIGNMYKHERVNVVTEDARTYIKQFENKFDVIYSLSSNSWAAMGSGAFAFAENYIFTVEAFEDYWKALTPKGFLSMEHQMYMPRIVSCVKEALINMDVENPEKHFAVYDIPKMRRKLILLSKQELTEDIIKNAYGKLETGNYNDKFILYPTNKSNYISEIITKGYKALEDSSKINIEPATDDKPFIAQLGLWKNFNIKKLEKTSVLYDFSGFPMTKTLILSILIIILILFIPLILIPYKYSMQKLSGKAWLYFFMLGLGYISIEVILIQKFILFIGASFYGIATIMFTMLLVSGIGSSYAKRFSNKTVFIGIFAGLALIIILSSFAVNYLYNLPAFARAVISGLIVAPAAFFMGMPFPKGAIKVKGLIDWGFAVNGVASVMGSVLVMFIVFEYGFNLTLILFSISYLLAFILLQKMIRD